MGRISLNAVALASFGRFKKVHFLDTKTKNKDSEFASESLPGNGSGGGI